MADFFEMIIVFQEEKCNRCELGTEERKQRKQKAKMLYSARDKHRGGIQIQRQKGKRIHRNRKCLN